MKIEIEYSDEEVEEAHQLTQPYRTMIRDNAPLMSLLYDIDLLPEQIKLYVNALRMVAVCELFKMTLNNNHGDNHVPVSAPVDGLRLSTSTDTNAADE
jgi:hypothetical protein